jgi:hypothetical protein
MHGLVFFEERFCAAGPLPASQRTYPFSMPPSSAPAQLYPPTGEPAENSFDLKTPSSATPSLPRANQAAARPSTNPTTVLHGYQISFLVFVAG